MYAPTQTASTANPSFNGRSGIFPDSGAPANAPSSAPDPTLASTSTRSSPCAAWLAAPARDDAAITTSDVPIASRTGSRAPKLSAGRIKNPPPTPRNPDSTPMPSPSGMSTAIRGSAFSWSTGLPNVIRAAATKRMIANSSVSVRSDANACSDVPAIAPTIAAAANTKATRRCTCPMRQWPTAPTSAAPPTTSSDVPVASDADVCSP